MMKTVLAVVGAMYLVGIPFSYGSFVKEQPHSLQRKEQSDREVHSLDGYVKYLTTLVKENANEQSSCWNVKTTEKTGRQYRKVFSNPLFAMVFDVRYCDGNANGVIDRYDDLSFFMFDPETKRVAVEGIDYGLDGFLPLLKARGLGGEMFVASYDGIMFWGRPPGELTDNDKETIQKADGYYKDIVRLMVRTPNLHRQREIDYK